MKPVSARPDFSSPRIKGLTRFAVAITALNVIGHLYLGFEQSWITPFVALATAYATELVLETLSARSAGRPPRYSGSWPNLVVFLLPAHITGLAIAMLLMAHEQLLVIAFATSLAISSKHLFVVRIGRADRHFLNPSNIGITAALVLFPTVGIAPPYQFTEATSGFVDWLLPAFVICTGSLLNLKLTGRMPLIGFWLGAFAVQAVVRATIHGDPLITTLMPMTGFAFILFTFYMITDPATSPRGLWSQAAFGCAVAALYAVFMELHLVFGLFYALTCVTIARGLWFAMLSFHARNTQRAQVRQMEPSGGSSQAV